MGKEKRKNFGKVAFFMGAVILLSTWDGEKLKAQIAQKIKFQKGSIQEQEMEQETEEEQEYRKLEVWEEQAEELNQEIEERIWEDQEESGFWEIQVQEEKVREIEKGGQVVGHYIEVPGICQNPELPTGCESTAAAMLLQYYQVDVTAAEFASQWLECGELSVDEEGRVHGPNPAEMFAGDPFSSHAYGCFAPVIGEAVNKNCNGYQARILQGESLETLCTKYIDRGVPLLIWATIGMKPAYPGDSWILEDGSEFIWIAGEHCLVLTGYTDQDYLLNDPLTGKMTAYPRKKVEERFSELGSQAVVLGKYSPTKKERQKRYVE